MVDENKVLNIELSKRAFNSVFQLSIKEKIGRFVFKTKENMSKTKSLLLTFLLPFIGLSQESVASAGGNAGGSGGTSSYTVGQVAYTTNSNVNGSVSQGVQQVYEIVVTNGIEALDEINLSVLAYPNPVHNTLILSIENFQDENFQYKIFDASGKLVAGTSIYASETKIDMSTFVRASYFVHVEDQLNKNTLITFKVVKN